MQVPRHNSVPRNKPGQRKPVGRRVHNRNDFVANPLGRCRRSNTHSPPIPKRTSWIWTSFGSFQTWTSSTNSTRSRQSKSRIRRIEFSKPETEKIRKLYQAGHIPLISVRGGHSIAYEARLLPARFSWSNDEQSGNPAAINQTYDRQTWQAWLLCQHAIAG